MSRGWWLCPYCMYKVWDKPDFHIKHMKEKHFEDYKRIFEIKKENEIKTTQ